MECKRSIKSIVVLAVLGIAALFFMNHSLAVSQATVNVETANLRQTADSNSKILEQLSMNQEVEVLEKSGEWYQVKSKGITGYIRQDLLTVKEENANPVEETPKQENTSDNQEENKIDTQDNQEEAKKVVAENTKLKIVPSINATDIIEVKKEEEVEIIETMNGWVCIQTTTAKGWIREEKLKNKEEKPQETDQTTEPTQENQQPVEEKKLKTLFINSETVNLRKEANTTSEVISKLALNTSVDVYAEENGWSKVKVNGKEGYISSSLLSNKKQEVVTSRNAQTERGTTEQGQQATKPNQEETKKPAAPSSGKGATVVATAKRYIGCKYVYGGNGPNSFDCSGFTSYVFRQHGVSLNRTAAGQYSNGVAVSRSNLQPGDLVMFGKSGINHVGIYIGGGQMVHAANPSRGVTTDTINSGYYNNNYVGARRVM